MAKKRKRKKRPAPPPRPGATIEELTTGRRPEVRTESPATADAPAQPSAQERRSAAVQRRQATKRRGRRRTIAILALIVLAIAGVFAFRQIQNRQRTGAHADLAAAAGCGEVQEVGGLGREHWEQGQPVPTYETSPPAGGDHSASPLPANIYTEPFSEDINESPSIYQAVHSLEHGYIIVWTNGLSGDESTALEREVRIDDRKVIMAPYPQLGEDKMAMSAWGRLQACDQANPEVARSFIDLFREATAPEATAL